MADLTDYPALQADTFSKIKMETACWVNCEGELVMLFSRKTFHSGEGLALMICESRFV